ncbi:MAG: hypothetical protein OMM_05677 [Candidatus Magnetoglobus multicellularis str. Araruama]|uniref:Uncharacterized protein n=1 Tax=Candidatus Magnetoglobus multicellularis str. Araruama TaxID=890399 RepID=A0A1V1NUY7_9BACT|nr:MAG: hypothetical protein OMM_05677 [Candidatus Magnetoglobus multicellularis str. Araruama]
MPNIVLYFITKHSTGRQKQPRFLSNNCSLWPHKEALRISERLKSAKEEIFIVGFTLETTMQYYQDIFKNALDNEVTIKLLFTHPESSHVIAHQYFSDRDIKANIYTVNRRLKSFFESLSSSAKNKIRVKATYYLPRFSAVIVDNDVIMINFYLFNSSAQSNPALEIYRCKLRKEFDQIKNSLENLFNIESNNEPFIENQDIKKMPPNFNIIENGKFNDFP